MWLAQVYGNSSSADQLGVYLMPIIVIVVILVAVVFGTLIMIAKFYKKVDQGRALVRNGLGGTKVSFTGIVVYPIIHQCEYMDISIKRVEIQRAGSEGLICKDNMRADITVAFFVRVNSTKDDVLKVAQSVGCARASDVQKLRELFDAKFSEGLKTVGRQFDFVDLYNARGQFKDEILKVIGTDLNGYVLDDAAIDHLEQTKLEFLSANNILDASGIKKITELTAREKILANQIDRDREKTVTKQDVEAEEAILELNRQLAESQQKQIREIATVTARENAETAKVTEEQRLKSERARIAADEEIQTSEENKNRAVIVATRNKERTDAVEQERILKDQQLEMVERERIVELAQIEKQRAVEQEQKNIQDVIKERVMVERLVVEEKERIKDTEAFAGADRKKQVAVTAAKELAEQELIQKTQQAEADKQSAELKALQVVIDAEAAEKAAIKNSNAKKVMAEGIAAEHAATGMAEVSVKEAMAGAVQKEGEAEANVIRVKAVADAEGITKKAEAMKLFDTVGKDHEEFKLRLELEKDIKLAELDMHTKVAVERADIVGEALKSANIDIIGGESTFFDKITGAVAQGRAIDGMVNESSVLTDVREALFDTDAEVVKAKIKSLTGRFGVDTNDIKNLSIAAVLSSAIANTGDSSLKGVFKDLLESTRKLGLDSKKFSEI